MSLKSEQNDRQFAARSPWQRRVIVVALAVAILLSAVGLFRQWGQRVAQNSATPNRELVPRQVVDGDFSSSASCLECHPKQHESWSRTYHRTMTQLATPATVLADFRHVELTARGRWYRLDRKEDAFWVTMREPAWEASQQALGVDPNRHPNPPTVTKPIVMTTGSHHMQGYWFPSGRGNELWQLPFYFHLADQRWLPREDVFLRTPDNDEHLANWNMVCIKCHSVAGIPGGDPTQTAMNSEVAELGIACEACHGPGAEHVALRRSLAKHDAAAPAHDPIVSPSRSTAKTQSEICGQCHSEFFPADPVAFWNSGIGYRAGGDFEQTHAVIQHDGPIYRDFQAKFEHTFWNDGTCRVGGDEFNALAASPCYQRGELSCLSCHSLHESDPNDLLADGMRTNEACLQCHDAPRFREDLAQHTHHAPQSSGSLCYNCHMPHTSYALMTAMRSHRITSPRAMSIVRGSPPNACNLCHLDQTLGWTSKYLARWYSQPPVTLRDDELRVAASLVGLLRGDAMQRAISAWHFGWKPAQEISGDRWQAPFLSRLLSDPYAAVRYQAVKALQSLPELAEFEADFIGPEGERKAAETRAYTIWHAHRPDKLPENHPQLLLDENFEVRLDRVDRLLEQRDDHDVRIPE